MKATIWHTLICMHMWNIWRQKKEKSIMMRMDYLCFKHRLHLRLNLLYVLETLNGDCMDSEAIDAQPFLNGWPSMNVC